MCVYLQSWKQLSRSRILTLMDLPLFQCIPVEKGQKGSLDPLSLRFLEGHVHGTQDRTNRVPRLLRQPTVSLVFEGQSVRPGSA